MHQRKTGKYVLWSYLFSKNGWNRINRLISSFFIEQDMLKAFLQSPSKGSFSLIVAT